MSRFQEIIKKLDEESSSLVTLKDALKKVEENLDTENEKVSEYLKKRGN
jgi:predicted transcriptional regulator YheO